jgi:hypothetical protein
LIITFLWDFSSFLMSSEAFSAKMRAMSLPYPGLTTSKLASKTQSSAAKRASALSATLHQWP